ncbi:MAG: hypothetical protein JXR48_08245 [Candidatus Delongbacteria bacterium]|nr:hypothetical protein [Candidatus Delongbacteria bacterium]MBN2834944.1 hypothetical protein [Candidatus Delongbacteria bacterium]
MRIKEIIDQLNAKLLTGDMETSFEFGFSSDLMSDVLRIDDENVALITGLSNLQVIRTAEMMDIAVIIIVRGKRISEEMLQLAKEKEIAILSTGYSMYKVSGLLYNLGVKAVF